MSSFLGDTLSFLPRSTSVTDHCQRSLSKSLTADDSFVAKLKARKSYQTPTLPKMKFSTSSLTSKDVKRHMRERQTLEDEIQRVRSERQLTAAVYRPTRQQTPECSRPMRQSTVDGSPRKLLGKRPSFASLSGSAKSASPSPATPQIATPLTSTPLLQVPEQGEFFSEARDYIKSVGESNQPGVHTDFLGICQDGTAAWAPSDESPALETTLKSRPISFKAKRPKINVVIPENIHKKRLSAVLKKSPSIDTIAVHPSPNISSVSAFAEPNPAFLSTPNLRKSKPPRSLRPFSRCAPKHIASLQMLRNESPELPPLSHSSSASSDDDLASNYSRKSSVSSIAVPDIAGMEGWRPMNKTASAAFSIVTPGRAGVYDEPAPAPPKIPARFQQQSRIDLSNKPLPPEPKDLEHAPSKPPRMMRMEPDPLRIGGLPPSRFVLPRHLAPEPIYLDSDSIRKSPRRDHYKMKRNSISSLRSKYTANDLDALDHAFQRALPPRSKHMTLEEAEMELEIHLSTITARCSVYTNSSGIQRPDSPTLNSPLQISRGPMQMEPSRPPPSPPLSRKLSKASRAGSMLSIKVPALAHRSSTVPSTNQWRHSSALGASKDPWTVNRAGTVAGSSAVQLKLRPPVQSRSLPHSPDLPLTGGSEEEKSQPSDPAVMEIHRRLELLQMDQNSQAARVHDELARQYLPQIQVGSDDISMTDFVQLYPPPPIPDEESRPLVPERSSLRSSRCKSTATIRSLASLAVSDIPDLYANMPPSESTEQLRRDMDDRNISPSAAESILLHILMALDNLKDLFSAATVSKGFYRTFKRHEMMLMKNALRKMSPPAWELREVTPPVNEGEISDAEPVPDYTPSTYLRYYTRDLYTMVALKSLIVERCQHFLRIETIAALTGKCDKRSLELDNAFWRVWTFCKIFGSNKQREDEVAAQVDWLRGGRETRHAETSCRWSRISDHAPFGAAICASDSFGKGNCDGLDEHELWDMTEIWVCLGVLLRGFLNPKKREMAREYGIFENARVVEGDQTTEEEVIEEWTHYLLTLGPAVILDLATPSSMPTAEGFEIASENGWTDWTPPPSGVSRGSFLKVAATRLYQEHMGGSGLGSSRSVSPCRSIVGVRAPERRSQEAQQLKEQEDKVEWFKALRRLGTPNLTRPVAQRNLSVDRSLRV